MNFLKQIHWSAVGSFAATVAGALMSPQVLGVVGAKTAAVLVIGGSLAQAATKPVQQLKPPASPDSPVALSQP